MPPSLLDGDETVMFDFKAGLMPSKALLIADECLLDLDRVDGILGGETDDEAEAEDDDMDMRDEDDEDDGDWLLVLPLDDNVESLTCAGTP